MKEEEAMPNQQNQKDWVTDRDVARKREREREKKKKIAEPLQGFSLQAQELSIHLC